MTQQSYDCSDAHSIAKMLFENHEKVHDYLGRFVTRFCLQIWGLCSSQALIFLKSVVKTLTKLVFNKVPGGENSIQVSLLSTAVACFFACSQLNKMNRIVMTDYRLVLPVVGPSGSVKPRIFFVRGWPLKSLIQILNKATSSTRVSTNVSENVRQVKPWVCSTSRYSNDQVIRKLSFPRRLFL